MWGLRLEIYARPFAVLAGRRGNSGVCVCKSNMRLYVAQYGGTKVGTGQFP